MSTKHRRQHEPIQNEVCYLNEHVIEDRNLKLMEEKLVNNSNRQT